MVDALDRGVPKAGLPLRRIATPRVPFVFSPGCR